MDVIELVAILGDKYNLVIEPNKMNHIKTVGDIVEYVLQSKDNKNQRSSIESFYLCNLQFLKINNTNIFVKQ